MLLASRIAVIPQAPRAHIPLYRYTRAVASTRVAWLQLRLRYLGLRVYQLCQLALCCHLAVLE